MIADMHVHSTFSPDGISTMEEQCIAALEKGERIICFTDHVDYNVAEKNNGIIKDNSKANFIIEEYLIEIDRLRKKYPELKILKGIEFSEPHLFKKEFERYSQYPFDYILGSVHHCYEGVFPGAANISEDEAIKEYYDIMIRSLEECFFDGMEVLSKFGVHISFAEKCISGKMCPVENIDEIDIMSFSTDAHTLSGPLVGGATKTALILAVNKERFVIKNAYLKTDVMDMLRFLDSIGKNVEIIGPDIIIQGAVKRNIVYETPFSLTQCISEIITYSILCLASGKKVRFLNLNRTTIERSLAPEFSLFKQMGVVTVWQGTDLIVYAPTKINSIDIVVQPSTIQSDHHPFFAFLLLFGQKQVTLTEYVWKDRFKYIENLQKMGAIINVNGNQITITPSELKKYEGNLPALDVRSAAVTLVASIVSRSHVDIIDAHHIFRGYSRLKQNMQELGIELHFRQKVVSAPRIRKH